MEKLRDDVFEECARRVGLDSVLIGGQRVTSATPTAFVLGAGFSAAEQFPLVRGLRERVLHFLEAEQHSAYRTFLTPGNGGFREGQFRAGLNAVDPNETLAFEELLIELSKRKKTARNDDPSFIAERVLRIGCARLLWCIQNSIWRAGTAYQNFASWLSRYPGNGVISFNWDLLVEKTLTDAGLTWSYGLDGAATPVIKPHGSINWSGHLREGLRAEYDGWQPLGGGSRLCFDLAEPLSNPNKQEINSTLRYVIFPGDPELPGQDADVRWLWDRAGEVLARAQKIVFIGYSLPGYDSFADTFFRDAATGKTIEAITPASDHLERYRIAFGGRAVLRPEKFEQCEYALPLP